MAIARTPACTGTAARAILAMLLIVSVLAPATSASASTVSIPDANLEAAVRAALAKPTGDLTTADMQLLVDLSAPSKGIVNLVGLESATNLETLDLIGNQVTDLAPLGSLSGLTLLDLRENGLSNTRPLSGLVGLTELFLSDNQIADVAPLGNLTNLRALWLSGNKITSIAALSKLTGLNQLLLDVNQLTDVAVVSRFIGLTELQIGTNRLTDISAISGLMNLTDSVEARYNYLDLRPGSPSRVAIAAQASRAVSVSVDPQSGGAIVVAAGPHGVITPSSTQAVDFGTDSVEFGVIPDVGYHIADVTVDGSSVGAVSSYRFAKLSTSKTLAATFAVNLYTITSSSGANGTISPLGSQPVSHGADSSPYTIAAASGFHIEDVKVDGVSVGAVSSYRFTNVTANHTIEASFGSGGALPVSFAVTASSGPHGAISPSGRHEVLRGADSPTFVVTPAPGYRVSDVVVDGLSIGAQDAYRFINVQADHTIAAHFALNSSSVATFSIVPSAGPNGAISPGTPQTVNEGSDSATFTITPSPGFLIADVLVDGASVGALAGYKFVDVSSSHTIEAVFVVQHVTVKTTTVLSRGATRVYLRHTLRLYGTVRPAAASGSVTISKQRKVGSHWRSEGSVTRKLSGGRYSYGFRPSHRGTWRFVARYRGTPGDSVSYSGSASPSKSVSVR